MKFLALLIFALLGLCECFGKAGNDVLPPAEVQCNFLIGCNSFPQNKICALAVDGCYAPYTFGNDCELSVYNCNHPSNQFYKYWDGACFPEDDWITLSPIETGIPEDDWITLSPIETGTPQDDLITLSPIETEPIRITISPIERQPILVTLSPIETVTRPPKFYTIGPIIRQPLEVA